jgi:hypothetical protein
MFPLNSSKLVPVWERKENIAIFSNVFLLDFVLLYI